ncbi:ATP-binding protein [Vogesella mureinivorans]|uniref:ATP-binding protein n=1 Tax=Vogesella mureinivorans TaxID=657276 RepID=UPI0011C7FE72|nr:ATP-binding protein [Vogesella mureinivorans]
MSDADIIQRLEKRLAREHAARQEAERLLEAKSLALYTANCELAEAAHLLEEKVAERTLELSQALALAEAGVRAKTEFLAVMSHELRTPMNGVMGMAELLAATPLSPAQRELLHTLQESAEAQMVLIGDILDLSSIENGNLTLRRDPVDMPALLDGLLAQYRTSANAKGLSLWLERPDSLPWLKGDGDRLRQVLGNLLSNALKFTAEGQISLRVTLDKQPDGYGYWHVAVSDTGIGMSPQLIGRLFRTFEMADSSPTRRYGGTGVGLAISHRLAQAMQGDITVSSQVGEGSCFTFSWRAETVAAPVLAPSSTLSAIELPGPARELRVLVAEDNAINQKLIVKMLERLGLSRVTLADDGLQAVAVVETGNVDLVLMDMQMPNMSGVEATVAIRAQDLPVQPDIVALTANAFEEDRQACMQAGMDDFLTKPLKLDLLASVLCHAARGDYANQRDGG